MPEHFIEPPSVVREDLGDSSWVDVRVGIKWSQMVDLYDEVDMSKTAKRNSRAMQALIELGVVAWSFDRELTPEAISLLRPETATRLAELVSMHNPFLVSGGGSNPKDDKASAGSTSSKADAVS